MPDLVAGTRIRAADYPLAAFGYDDTLIENVTTTSYVTGTPVVDCTFVAPTSGRVLLSVGGGGRDDTANGDRVLLAPQVFEGTDATGVEVVAPNASLRGYFSGVVQSPFFGRWSRVTLLEGLTPEATHYARVMHRTILGAGTCEIQPRDIAVVPVP